MANPEHMAILAEGVEHWNGWRARTIGNRHKHSPDLSSVTFAEMDLSAIDFHDIVLSNALLQQVNHPKPLWQFCGNSSHKLPQIATKPLRAGLSRRSDCESIDGS